MKVIEIDNLGIDSMDYKIGDIVYMWCLPEYAENTMPTEEKYIIKSYDKDTEMFTAEMVMH